MGVTTGARVKQTANMVASIPGESRPAESFAKTVRKTAFSVAAEAETMELQDVY